MALAYCGSQALLLPLTLPLFLLLLPPLPQARIAETEAEIGTDLLGQLSGAEQAEVRQLQPQVAKLQVGGTGQV